MMAHHPAPAARPLTRPPREEPVQKSRPLSPAATATAAAAAAGRMLMGSSHSCRAGSCWPMKKNGKRNKHFFFFFLISISRSPLNTHENNRVNRRLSFWCFFFLGGGGFVYSPPYLRITISSHTCFSFFFVSFVSYFNFDERVFSRFYFFSFTSSSNSCSYLFSRLSTLFGYRSSCCC